jgi:hypothetical protein
MSFVNVALLIIARVPSDWSDRVERNSSRSSAYRRGTGEYTYYAPPYPGGQADFATIRNDTHSCTSGFQPDLTPIYGCSPPVVRPARSFFFGHSYRDLRESGL